MSETNQTQGPLCVTRSYDDWLVLSDDGMTPIAKCYADDGHADPKYREDLPAEGNARLFASAPALAARVERLEAILGGTSHALACLMARLDALDLPPETVDDLLAGGNGEPDVNDWPEIARAALAEGGGA